MVKTKTVSQRLFSHYNLELAIIASADLSDIIE